MSNSFFNLFRSRLGALGLPTGQGSPQVDVGIFGKHPAWTDHIPDLGVNQPQLIEFKRWLYEGITRNVDNGEWDKLKKSGLLVDFGHTFVQIMGHDSIVARCWKSTDGAGRDRYPMIAAALCANVSLDVAIRDVLPALKTLQQQFVSTQSSADVERFLQTAESALRRKIQDARPVKAGRSENIFRILAQRPEMGKDRQGLLRVLYHIERESPPDGTDIRPFTLRVPACHESIIAASELWLRFLSSNPRMPEVRCAIAPDHGRWLDLMVGYPASQDLFPLCAPVEVVPLTTDVPYTLERNFIDRVNHFLESRNPPENAWP